MITYWLRTCTPTETKEMAKMVEGALLEVAEQTTEIDFGTEELARERPSIPTMLKGRGLRKPTVLRAPAFVGAIFDILTRCIDRKDETGELTKGVYAKQLSGVIGEGAYDMTAHRNEKFLEATTIGPYPRECHEAWDKMREEAIANYSLAHESN